LFELRQVRVRVVAAGDAARRGELGVE